MITLSYQNLTITNHDIYQCDKIKQNIFYTNVRY